MTSILPQPEQTWLDNNGLPLAGGKIYTYIPSSTTPKATWQDANQVVLNGNPVVADSSGRTIIYGSGTYRIIVQDSLGNQIYDQESAATLDDSVISAAMLPVVGASTTSEARDLMGVTAAISAAISAINLITGPTGPVSTTPGPTGPTGATGSAGSGATTLFKQNPGYFKDLNSGFVVQFGNGATPSTGQTTVMFPLAWPTTVVALLSGTSGGGEGGWWSNTVLTSDGPPPSGFVLTTSSPFVGGNYVGGPMGFWWFAVGW